VALIGLVALAALTASVTAATAQEKSFLWRATKGDRTVHLLGSIHFLKEESYPLAPEIEEAYRRSGAVRFETDIDALGTAALELLAAGSLEDGRKLDQVIPNELYAQLSESLEAMGMDASILDGMKPWFAAQTLLAFELMRNGYSGQHGVDAHFNRRAKADGKPRKGLETIAAQVALFSELDDSQSVDFLRYALLEADTMIPMVEELVASWERGDVGRLEELLTDGYAEHPALFERFVVDRNLLWMPQIEALFDGDVDTLVVVGALHLVGERGLIELLRAKGVTLEQR
jgi:uncharacterized protein YbaP (TraB family)